MRRCAMGSDVSEDRMFTLNGGLFTTNARDELVQPRFGHRTR